MDIKIVGIAVDQVGQPRNDGSPGSGLYRVPLNLSESPSRIWAELFETVWDSPPRYTSMHRPGIGKVRGNQIVLDGTTVEEVRDVHLETLNVVVAEVNKKATEIEEKQRKERERTDADARAHQERVRDIASKIKFDK